MKTSKDGAPILHGKGLADVQKRIRDAFAVAHERLADEIVKVEIEVQVERRGRTTEEKANLLCKAASLVVPAPLRHSHSGKAFVIEVPLETAEELILMALSRLGKKEDKRG
jgi:hypothetical protein